MTAWRGRESELPRHHCIVLPTQTCQAGLFERCNSHRGSPLGHPKSARQFGAGAGGGGAARRRSSVSGSPVTMRCGRSGASDHGGTASRSIRPAGDLPFRRRAHWKWLSPRSKRSVTARLDRQIIKICPERPVERIWRAGAPQPYPPPVSAL